MNVYECIRIYTVYSKYVSIYDMYTRCIPDVYIQDCYTSYTRRYTRDIHMYIYTSGKGSILTDANTPQKGLADETARSSDPRHQRLAQRHRQTTLLHYDFKNCVSKMRNAPKVDSNLLLRICDSSPFPPLFATHNTALLDDCSAASSTDASVATFHNACASRQA